MDSSLSSLSIKKSFSSMVASLIPSPGSKVTLNNNFP